MCFSSYLGATGRHSGRPAVSSGVSGWGYSLARQDSTPFCLAVYYEYTSSVCVPSPLDQPMVDAARDAWMMEAGRIARVSAGIKRP